MSQPRSKPCARSWQVEAARDGRLTGKDLASALRHRETCAECTAAAARLAELGAGIAELPAQPFAALTARRVRQNLLAAFNETVLDPPRAKSVPRRAWLLAFGLVGALGGFYFWVGQRARPSVTQTRLISAVEVHASAGARFTDQLENGLDRVVFDDGQASFTVHPHPNRPVLIALPDGELEDLGTIFDLSVREGHTQTISVSTGRIAVRLRERAPFTLTAGESWQREPAASAVPSIAPGPSATPPVSSAAPAAPTSNSGSNGRASTRALAHAAAAPSASQKAPSISPSSDSTKAEDDAYLEIIGALRGGKTARAHALAKSYLLRFPSGFRRIEVLNIATREADAGSD